MPRGRRKPTRQTPLHKRPGALHAKNIVELRHLERSLVSFMLISDCKPTASKKTKRDAEVMEFMGVFTACQREELLRERTVHRNPVARLRRTIASVDDCDAYHNLRCLKEDLPRLMRALRFPPDVKLDNGSIFDGEEAFLLLLYRMRYPCRYSDLERYFGREYSQLSRLFRWATEHVFELHRFRVEDNLEYWAPHLRRFAAAIYKKGRDLGLTHSDICAFIDGTLRRMCRPDGHDDIQRDVYDGHHRDHGLSYQAVQAPNGMIIDAHGPESGRRHDVHLLRKSNLNARLAAVQNPENEVQYKVYGDAAYPVLSHVRRGFRGANLSSEEKAFNQANSAMRISVEWAFGKVVNMYPFCDFRKNQKLFLQPLAKYYINACILTNAHTCLRGSQTGTYFDVHAPTLEEYFA